MRFLYIFTMLFVSMAILYSGAGMFYFSIINNENSAGFSALLCFGNMIILSYVIDSWIEFGYKL